MESVTMVSLLLQILRFKDWRKTEYESYSLFNITVMIIMTFNITAMIIMTFNISLKIPTLVSYSLGICFTNTSVRIAPVL